MSITRGRSEGGYYGRKEDTLQIRYDLDQTPALNVDTDMETLATSVLARHHRILDELLLEAKKAYMAAQESTISIYASDSCVSLWIDLELSKT
jgi:chaperone BCS1